MSDFQFQTMIIGEIDWYPIFWTSRLGCPRIITENGWQIVVKSDFLGKSLNYTIFILTAQLTSKRSSQFANPFDNSLSIFEKEYLSSNFSIRSGSVLFTATFLQIAFIKFQICPCPRPGSPDSSETIPCVCQTLNKHHSPTFHDISDS